jgi:hypothetical protein
VNFYEAGQVFVMTRIPGRIFCQHLGCALSILPENSRKKNKLGPGGISKRKFKDRNSLTRFATSALSVKQYLRAGSPYSWAKAVSPFEYRFEFAVTGIFYYYNDQKKN